MAGLAFRILAVGACAAALYVTPASAEPREIQGIVVTNQNGQLTIKTPAGNQTYSLPADARIRSYRRRDFRRGRAGRHACARRVGQLRR